MHTPVNITLKLYEIKFARVNGDTYRKFSLMKLPNQERGGGGGATLLTSVHGRAQLFRVLCMGLAFAVSLTALPKAALMFLDF